MIWLPRALATLERFATLTKGWDTYGAPPIDPRALSSARVALEVLAELGVAEPLLQPTSCGGVDVSWNDETLSLEFFSDGTIGP